jgi:hypothetical protein
MSPRLAWAVGVILLSGGGIYCLVYSFLSGRPDGLGIAVQWALVSLLPWLVAFEASKRVNYEPTGSWKANWWRIAAILSLTAAISVLMQDWLWADGHYSTREAAIVLLRRIPPAALVSLLLIIIPMLQLRAEASAPGTAGQLPVLPRQIDWIRAGGNYLEINAGQRLILHRMTMASAERLLRQHNFVRVHRSALVNAERVKKLERGKIADEILLKDGTRLKVGTAYRAFVERTFDERLKA